MSILIKGMEMPTDHPLWIVVHSDGTVEANEVSQSRPVGWQTLRNAAVPVPPHGDLIDRREAIIDANERAYDFWLCDDEVNATIQFLKEQPTIIAAEEGGK